VLAVVVVELDDDDASAAAFSALVRLSCAATRFSWA
jgi:hypothetical protein